MTNVALEQVETADRSITFEYSLDGHANTLIHTAHHHMPEWLSEKVFSVVLAE